MNKAIDMGAIVDESQRKTIEDLCKLGCDEGGEMWQPSTELPDKGCFFLFIFSVSEIGLCGISLAENVWL